MDQMFHFLQSEEMGHLIEEISHQGHGKGNQNPFQTAVDVVKGLWRRQRDKKSWCCECWSGWECWGVKDGGSIKIPSWPLCPVCRLASSSLLFVKEQRRKRKMKNKNKKQMQ
jgi:hypothetical protein